MMKQLTLAIVLTIVAGGPVSAQALRAVERITIDDLKALMADKKVVIIDVRNEQEFGRGRIPGAVNINYTDIVGQAQRFAKEKRTIVTYCACANEATSARAAVDLAARGIGGVKALKDGWDAWIERKEPVEK